MRRKQETNVTCPACGTELAFADKKVTIAESPATSIVSAQLPKTAHERIEALRNAGVDVSCLFAMHGANGGDYVASNKDGKLSILDDNDPIFDYILEKGTVPNRRLFRRFVMAQMFHMLSYKDYGAWSMNTSGRCCSTNCVSNRRWSATTPRTSRTGIAGSTPRPLRLWRKITSNN